MYKAKILYLSHSLFLHLCLSLPFACAVSLSLTLTGISIKRNAKGKKVFTSFNISLFVFYFLVAFSYGQKNNILWKLPIFYTYIEAV